MVIEYVKSLPPIDRLRIIEQEKTIEILLVIKRKYSYHFTKVIGEKWDNVDSAVNSYFIDFQTLFYTAL